MAPEQPWPNPCAVGLATMTRLKTRFLCPKPIFNASKFDFGFKTKKPRGEILTFYEFYYPKGRKCDS